eukprot:m.61914 g.61914  ORF g.61914 m.61914 type:complete len:55 (+) comp7109_c0_seq1:1389-1553(+)
MAIRAERTPIRCCIRRLLCSNVRGGLDDDIPGWQVVSKPITVDPRLRLVLRLPG